ncbi:MAG: endonuclease/exonuclease/phosphatase family protein [Chitinophagales bacterium]|nr:endonuclease/exonuclease/phosphatase family protein [Chitinophagales bacterium]HNL06159.1 endonuclease/exonuclease/phosphatase family protein [Chitinophagales bacterium]
MSIRGFFKNIVYRVNVAVALLLLLTYSAPYINPQFFWLPALSGLTYNFLLLVNVGFVAFWLYRRSWYILLSLGVIVLGAPLLQNTFAFRLNSWGNKNAQTADSLRTKIMSYNVNNFDLYNWNKNEESRNKMLELIRGENPDIICFQDFYTQDDSVFNNISELQNKLNYPYFHLEKTLTLREKDHWGLAVFSRYPLYNAHKIKFNNSKYNGAFQVDVSVHERPMRLFNVHLQSTHLAPDDLKYVKKIGENIEQKETSEHWRSISSIVEKLRTAYEKRSEQAQIIADSIAHSPYSVVVCGDFNDTPVSYSYRKISHPLQDGFLSDGIGFGGTYSIGPLPPFRIDYVLVDTSFVVYNFDIIASNKNRSDHSPVVCEIGWKD